MPLNECVGVACLPHRDEMPGTNCSITGWGTLKSFGKTPEVLWRRRWAVAQKFQEANDILAIVGI